MSFELNDEKALDVLIWWVEGSDGSIDFYEEEAVENILKDMNYSPETYYEDTVMHISGLSTEKIEELVDNSIQHGSTHYSKHEKEKVVALLYAVAESNRDITEGQQEKIDRVKQAFNVGNLKSWEEE